MTSPEQTARPVKTFNRICRWSLCCFVLSFAAMWVFMTFWVNAGHATTFGWVPVILVLASGVVYIVAVVLRDAAALGAKPRFSLRELMITTTFVGVALGLLVHLLRK